MSVYLRRVRIVLLYTWVWYTWYIITYPLFWAEKIPMDGMLEMTTLSLSLHTNKYLIQEKSVQQMTYSLYVERRLSRLIQNKCFCIRSFCANLRYIRGTGWFKKFGFSISIYVRTIPEVFAAGVCTLLSSADLQKGFRRTTLLFPMANFF